MRYTFLQTPLFTAKWRSLRLEDEDLRHLEQELLRLAPSHPAIPGTGGVRKMRFAPPSWNRGKSGATRVCYVCFTAFDVILLVLMYAKNEQANLTPRQRDACKLLISEIAAELERQR